MDDFEILFSSYRICILRYQSQIGINLQRNQFFILFTSVAVVINWVFFKLSITLFVTTINAIGYGAFINGVEACKRIAKQKLLIGEKLKKSPDGSTIETFIEGIEEALKEEYTDPSIRFNKLPLGSFNHYTASVFILLFIVNFFSLVILFFNIKNQ